MYRSSCERSQHIPAPADSIAGGVTSAVRACVNRQTKQAARSTFRRYSTLVMGFRSGCLVVPTPRPRPEHRGSKTHPTSPAPDPLLRFVRFTREVSRHAKLRDTRLKTDYLVAGPSSD